MLRKGNLRFGQLLVPGHAATSRMPAASQEDNLLSGLKTVFGVRFGRNSDLPRGVYDRPAEYPFAAFDQLRHLLFSRF
jgi:hypothetical protein